MQETTDKKRTKTENMRRRGRAELQPKLAPCKGRVLMTRKQQEKRTIILRKDKRTSPKQGTSTYVKEEPEDKRTTTNEDNRQIDMRTRGQDNKIIKREKENTRTRTNTYAKTEDQRTG